MHTKNPHPSFPQATTGMHPAQSWRDGWNDGIRGLPFASTQTYAGDSALLYSDGYSCGAVRRGEIISQRVASIYS